MIQLEMRRRAAQSGCAAIEAVIAEKCGEGKSIVEAALDVAGDSDALIVRVLESAEGNTQTGMQAQREWFGFDGFDDAGHGDEAIGWHRESVKIGSQL